MRPTCRSQPRGAAAGPAEPRQRDKTTWVVRCAAARPATFAYRVWWNDLNGSFSQIDSTHIDLNPGNTFVYVVGHKPDAVTVRYEGPPGWRVMNGDPAPGPTYRFPNYDVMIDHPAEISDAFTTDSFVVGKVTYRMLLHAAGDPGPMRPRLLQRHRADRPGRCGHVGRSPDPVVHLPGPLPAWGGCRRDGAPHLDAIGLRRLAGGAHRFGVPRAGWRRSRTSSSIPGT